jgi:hypothetical protein
MTDPASALRKLRMAQISAMVAIALVLILPFFVYTARWQSAFPLFGGLVISIICFLLNRRGQTARATLLLLSSITAMSSALMWWGDGLKDAALLAFPAHAASFDQVVQGLVPQRSAAANHGGLP